MEYKFQSQKLQKCSCVHEWLMKASNKFWSVDEFDKTRKEIQHCGKLSSYIVENVNGMVVANGLLLLTHCEKP